MELVEVRAGVMARLCGYLVTLQPGLVGRGAPRHADEPVTGSSHDRRRGSGSGHLAAGGGTDGYGHERRHRRMSVTPAIGVAWSVFDASACLPCDNVS